MDPNATLSRIHELTRDCEHLEALNSAYDLLHWVDRGGFPPSGMDAVACKRFVRTLIVTIESMAGIN